MGINRKSITGHINGKTIDNITGRNVTDVSVTIDGQKISLNKPVKVELHHPSGKVVRSTTTNVNVIQEHIREVKLGIWVKAVIGGRTFKK